MRLNVLINDYNLNTSWKTCSVELNMLFSVLVGLNTAKTASTKSHLLRQISSDSSQNSLARFLFVEAEAVRVAAETEPKTVD